MPFKSIQRYLIHYLKYPITSNGNKLVRFKTVLFKYIFAVNKGPFKKLIPIFLTASYFEELSGQTSI